MRRLLPPGMLPWLGGVAGILLVTALRLLQVSRLADQGHFAKYSYFVCSILAGELPVHRLGDLSPGYLWSLVSLQGLLGLGIPGIRALQIAALGLVALMVAMAGKRLAGGLGAVVAAVVVLGNRAALLNATAIEPETLILVLNTAGCCLLVTAGHSRRAQVLAGLFFGLSAVTRPSVLLAVVLLAGCCWWRQLRAPADRSGPRRLLAALPVGFLAAVLLPLLLLQLAYRTVPGADTVMNPGTVFYEGANPATTGLIGSAPQVVKDLERLQGEPDALHLAYRQVARQAVGEQADRAMVNRYWSSRAVAFVRSYPGAYLRLLGQKLVLAVSSSDAHDLLTVVRKDRQLAGWQWLPYGLLIAGGLVGALRCRQRWPSLLLAVYLTSYLVVMLVFYVSARQRNPMLPALALLCGCAAQALATWWRQGDRRRLVLWLGGLLLLSLLLGRENQVQREDHHAWTLADRVDRIGRELGPDPEQAGLVAQVLNLGEPRHPVSSALVQAAVRQELARDLSLARRFDLAVVSQRIGDWAVAERLLEQLTQAGYRPCRGGALPGSLAFYRARCALALGHREQVPGLLEQAAQEAPGQADLLALLAVTGGSDRGRSPRQLLDQLHDPFTAGLALATAWQVAGDETRAAELIAGLRRRIPAWQRLATAW